VRVLTLPGVFKPRSDSWLLTNVMLERGLAASSSVLDLFAGSGVVAIAAAQDGARAVTAIDLSRRAALTTRLNARLQRVRVRALQGDMFDPVGGERFDLIAANPPYLPGAERLPARGPSRAWEGGPDGRVLLNRVCAEAGRHLTAAGSLLLVHSSLCGEPETLERLRRGGLRAAVLARREGPLGPLVVARSKLLEDCGVLRPGQSQEELIVIGARREN